MQKIDGRFVYSASDLNNYLECRHLTALDRLVAERLLERPERGDTVELIAKKGSEHEQRHLERLTATYGDRLVVFPDRPDYTEDGLRAAEAAALEAMAAGAEMIYQPTFFDGTFVGRADFLRRVDDPDSRWGWSYEVLDTKLALSTRPYFLLQLCNYSEHLARLTGTRPEHGYIVLGNGIEKRYRIDDYAAYYRHVRDSFLANVDSLGDPYPWAVSHCAICPWDEACTKRREADDHLSTTAGIRRDQITKLVAGGIPTLTHLAEASDEHRPPKLREKSFVNLREQARQQVAQRLALAAGDAYPYRYKFRPTEDQSGFAHLPEPKAGDVFFDIEGDPLYRADRGLEYLFGLYLPDEDRYVPFWARDASQERAAFEALVDFLVARAAEFPAMHVYHYAPYETTALRRLMGRYASREDAIDNFLRRSTFVDLYPIVRQALWISQDSYSLKKVEQFYAMRRAAETRRGDDSIVNFELWLDGGPDSILEDIERYNEEDCRSTHQLRDWLVGLRAEFNAGSESPIPWFTPPPPVEVNNELLAESPLAASLLTGLPAPESLAELRAQAESLRARWLLGNLLQYHRREAKPEWWAYFHRAENPGELLDLDREALAGLFLVSDVAPYKLSKRDLTMVYTFAFPPQEHHLKNKPHCPDKRSFAGEIVSLDDDGLRLELKLARKIEPAELRALIPGPPINSAVKAGAIERIAEMYRDENLERELPATYDILLARVPRLRDRPRGARIQPALLTKETFATTVQALDRSYLFVQGPPGSGKTTMGAWAIVDLIAAGKRVGVMANSHKAVHNLLRKVEETAKERGISFAGAHKETETEGSAYVSVRGCDFVVSVEDIAALSDPLCQLASGTPYAWTSAKLAGDFDYLFVDEAGQIPIADALGASLKADNVVFLGDPLQLPQVSQGSHPIGTNLSVLEHLLGDAATVPENAGVFLDRSYRMHPAIGDFISRAIYEGRLRTAERTRNNAVESPGLAGSGLRFLPVEHEGNSRFAPEEAERIVAEVEQLMRGTVTLGDEPARPLTQADVLIVAPYNMQRRAIAEALRKAGFGEIRVGTVDKFQGQEAPVVFYSMTTSSAENIPRGKEFLFDKNRFNVAVSRAQCLSILVCSPALLDAPCRKPEEMLLVNLLCAFVEAARNDDALRRDLQLREARA
jgi:uncharacterized protein